MNPRINPYAASPDGYKALIGLEQYLSRCGLEKMLVHLIKLRASQINGCAYCIDMHWKDLRRRRNRAATLWPRCVARIPYYTERRARCFGVDRSSDADHSGPCAGRDLRIGAQAVQRKRTERSDHRGGDDQCVESSGDFATFRAGKLSAGNALGLTVTPFYRVIIQNDTPSVSTSPAGMR